MTWKRPSTSESACSYSNTDCGRREGSAQDVSGRLATLWTMRDGKVSRLDTHETRADGLKAAGLPE
jgi:hypothetical protein